MVILSLFAAIESDCLPSATKALAFASKSAAQLRENERRQIVEIGRAEIQFAGRQFVCAERERAGEPRRSEAEPEIVDDPAAVVAFFDMRRTLQSMAVDIAGQGSVRVDKASDVIGERFERDAGRLAIEEPSFTQVRLQRGGEIGRRSAESAGDLGLAADSRVEDLGLRNLDARAEIDLVASVLPIEARGPMLSARQKVGEAKPAAWRQPRGAGHGEGSAGHPVEHRVGRLQASSHARQRLRSARHSAARRPNQRRCALRP